MNTETKATGDVLELLRRWSNLTNDTECRADFEDLTVYYSVRIAPLRLRGVWEKRKGFTDSALSDIRDSVEYCIEARGWGYSLNGEPTPRSGHHWAKITGRDIEPIETPLYPKQSAAVALLSAYLQALEAHHA